MLHQQGSSFLAGMKYYLKKGQPGVIRLRWWLMPMIGNATETYTNVSLFAWFCFNKLQTREVTFADDLTVAGKLADIKNFWDKLSTIGPKYGYFPKSIKSYLIVKKIA